MATHESFHPTRRHFLQGAGAVTAALALSPRRPASAQAASRIVLGTWGGDYSKLLTKNVEAHLAPRKIQVEHAIGGDPERRAKLLAEARLPRGTSDLQALSAANMFEMKEAGVLETLDYGKIENARNLLPQMKYPYGVGHIYSGKVILFNPKMIGQAPTSFADTLDPKHGQKLGIIDIQYQFTMMAAALASGGSMSSFEPGKERLMAVKKAGVRIYPTNEALAQALKNEEIGICIMWKARAVQWQNAGITVETVAAKEGVPLYVSGFAIPKNAQNKDGAYAYLNAMLEPSAQEGFAQDMGYIPTVKNAKVPEATQKRIGFTADEQQRLKDLDYAYIAKNDSALKEWWDKVFKG